MSEQVLSLYVIYDHPRDFPQHYVMRRWDIHPALPAPIPNGNPMIAKELETVRQGVPPGYICIGRHSCDDPAILEVYI